MEAAAWVQAVGSILAIIAAFLVPMLMTRAEAKRQRKVAAMKLAVRMRRWLRKAQNAVLSVDGYDPQHEHEPACKIPSIPFSTSLENIIQLEQKLAGDLLRLVDERASILFEVDATNTYGSHSTDAHFDFCGRGAALVLSAIPVVEKLSKEAAWTSDTIDREGQEKLQKIVTAYNKRPTEYAKDLEGLS